MFVFSGWVLKVFNSAVVACFNLLYRHLPGQTVEKQVYFLVTVARSMTRPTTDVQFPLRCWFGVGIVPLPLGSDRSGPTRYHTLQAIEM
jgi:hypothetical protein